MAVPSLLEYLPALGRGLLTTAEVAVLSIAGCAVASLALGILRSAKQPSLRVVSGCAIEFFRGASALVFLFWVYYALPLVPGMPQPSPLVASIVVLTLVGGAYGAEIVRSGIEAVARGQSDACHALGLSPSQAMSRVILPQALSQIVPAFASLAIDMVKWTSIVSFVGVPDVLYVANAVRSTTFDALPVFAVLAVMYAALCFAFSLIFMAIEKSFAAPPGAARQRSADRRQFPVAPSSKCDWSATVTWDWSFAVRILPALLQGMWITILVSLASAVIALAGGLLFAVFASTSGRIGRLFARLVVEAFRGIPILVLLYFGFYALPQIGITLPAYLIGIVVLGVVYAAFCSEVYRGTLLTIPSGIRDACAALGLNGFVTWTRVLIPITVRNSLPALANYVLVLYRQSALLFAIGVPVLLARAQMVGYESFRYLEPYTMAGALYLLLNLPCVYLLHRLIKPNHG